MVVLMARSTVDRRLPRPPFATPGRRESMDRFHELLAEGTLEPVVDRTFPLDRVPDALALLASGRATGRIVITP